MKLVGILYICLSLIFTSTAQAGFCNIDRMNDAIEIIKNRTRQVKDFVAQGPSKLVNKLRLMDHNARVRYFESLGFLKIYKSEEIDKHIYELYAEAVDSKILDVEKANEMIQDLEREGLNKLLRKSKHPLGLRFRRVTSEKRTMSSLATELVKKYSLTKEQSIHLKLIFKNSKGLSPDEVSDIAKLINIPKGADLTELENYMEFLGHSSLKERKIGIEGINDVFKGEAKNKVFKKFLKEEMNVIKYESKVLSQHGLKNYDNLDPAIAKAIREEIGSYRMLSYACSSPRKNEFKENAAKAFVNAMILPKLAIKAGIYSFLHRKDEWDSSRWKDFGWEMIMNLILGRVIGKLMSGYNSPQSKFIKSWFLYAGVEAVLYRDVYVPGGIYGLVVGKKEIMISKDVHNMLRDPSKKDQLKELVDFIEKEKIADDIVQRLLKTDIEKIKNGDYIVPEMAKIKKDDSIENNYDVLVEYLKQGLAKKISEDQESRANKIYTFNRFYGTVAGVENIGSSMLILHVLCMNQNKSFMKKYALAVVLTLFDTVSMSNVYYRIRNGYVGY